MDSSAVLYKNNVVNAIVHIYNDIMDIVVYLLKHESI